MKTQAATMIRAAIALAAVALAYMAQRFGFFIEDEIHNILVLRGTESVAEVWRWANATDVHPPLGYALNRVLFGLTGDLDLLRTLHYAGFVAAAFFFVRALGTRLSARAATGLYALLALNGTFVMWVASLRWPAYFLPLYLAALACVLVERPRARQVWLLLLCQLALLHINYLALLVCPLLTVGWLYLQRPWRGDGRPRRIIGTAALALPYLLFIPQGVIFATQHLPQAGGQTAAPLKALMMAAMTTLVGTAVVPSVWWALAAGAYVAAGGVLIAYWRGMLAELRRQRWPAVLLGCYALGMAGLVLTGLGIKYRNALFLIPAVVTLLVWLMDTAPGRRAKALIGVPLALFALVGLVHGVAHTRTLKNGYDIPYRASIAAITDWALAHDCRLVATFDWPLAYGLEQEARIATVNLYFDPDHVLEPGDCLVLSYRGSLAPAYYRELAARFEAAAAMGPQLLLAEDPDHALKRRFDPVFPRYHFRVVKLAD